MAWAENTAAVESPQIVELVELSSRDAVHRFNAGRMVVEWGGFDWQPAPIKHGVVKTSADTGSSATLDLTAPAHPLLLRYIPNHPIDPTMVRIMILMPEDPGEVRHLFHGQVTSAALDRKTRTVAAKCQAGDGLLDREGPNIIYSAYCNHTLFDDGCGLAEGAYGVQAAVSVGEGWIEAPAFDGYADGWFTGGFVMCGTDYRMVTLHEGTRLYLLVPFDDRVQSGAVVWAYPGCDGSPQTCRDKFNNFRPGNNKGFCGMALIPDSNPVIWGFR